MPPEHAGQRPSKRRLRHWIAGVFGLLLVAAALLPRAASTDLLRDPLLQHLLGDSHLQIRSGGGRFSYVAGVTIDDLRIESADGGFVATAKQIRTAKSVVALWRSSPDLGAIEVDRPVVALVLGEPTSSPEQKDAPSEPFLPNAELNLIQGQLIIREAKDQPAVVDASDLTLDMQMGTDVRGVFLSVEGTANLADRETLHESDFDRGLQLVAPQLVGEIGLSGSYSVELSRFTWRQADAESPPEMSLEGDLVIHGVNASLKNDVTRRLVLAAAEVMELGEIPTQADLMEQSVCQFRWDGDGIKQRSEFNLLPSLAPGLMLRSTGRIGLDERLELQISLQFPRSLMDQTELAKSLAEHELKLLLTGEVNAPVLSAVPNQLWEQLARRTLDADSSQETEKQYAREVLETFRSLREE